MIQHSHSTTVVHSYSLCVNIVVENAVVGMNPSRGGDSVMRCTHCTNIPYRYPTVHALLLWVGVCSLASS